MRLLRCGPAITRSIASSISDMVIFFLFRRAASGAPSFTMFARSAPEKPGVRLASISRFTSSASGFPRACTSRMALRPFGAGLSTTMRRSKRPGRSSAGSRMSGRFVAAMRMIPALGSKPSISTSSWFRVCSRSSCPAHRIDLVDEDQTGRGFLGLIEQVADAGGAHADEHLHELRSGNGEEGHPRFAGDGLGQQRLAPARRPDPHDTPGDLGADSLGLLCELEDTDDLFEFLLGLVHAGHVVKGDL